jgi:anhydro-N-acetylmuramic acid kinase
MSGTSMDGVDGVLALFPAGAQAAPQTLAHVQLPFDTTLKASLMALQSPGDNEIEREAQAANALAKVYAACVQRLLSAAHVTPAQVQAVGVHGQTIRHRPELGYTRQANNPALLAELCDIDVVADFRSRDIAAGGQGAPLVPAFHRALFRAEGECRVVANVGGIANISVLRPRDEKPLGFDTGPGNALMDLWIARHQGQDYDRAGAWAAQGQAADGLLADMLAEPYFRLAPPKSTGRDLFHVNWLDAHLTRHALVAPVDVQRTLCELTARSLSQAILEQASDATRVFVCGGGAYNDFLMQRLREMLGQFGIGVGSTAELGVPPDQVEALAFAWLARQYLARRPGNLPSVTGAAGARILGALYPA